MKFILSDPIRVTEMGSRQRQEDVISVGNGVYVLCDGLGGMPDGDEAARLVSEVVCDRLSKHLEQGDIITESILSEVLKDCYFALNRAYRRMHSKMATTLAVVCFHRGGVIAAHIGDTRIYHLRPQEGEIRFMSRDHSMVNDLSDLGTMTREQAMQSNQRDVVTRALMPLVRYHALFDTAFITDVKPGDAFVVASDGIQETIEPEQWNDILNANADADATASDIILRSMNAEGNHSAIIVKVENVEAEPIDNAQPDNEREKNYYQNPLVITPKAVETPPVPAEEESTEVETITAVPPAVPVTEKKEDPVAPMAVEKKSGKAGTVLAVLLILAALAGVGYGAYYLYTHRAKPQTEVKPATASVATQPADTTTAPVDSTAAAPADNNDNYDPYYYSPSSSNNTYNETEDSEPAETKSRGLSDPNSPESNPGLYEQLGKENNSEAVKEKQPEPSPSSTDRERYQNPVPRPSRNSGGSAVPPPPGRRRSNEPVSSPY